MMLWYCTVIITQGRWIDFHCLADCGCTDFFSCMLPLHTSSQTSSHKTSRAAQTFDIFSHLWFSFLKIFYFSLSRSYIIFITAVLFSKIKKKRVFYSFRNEKKEKFRHSHILSHTIISSVINVESSEKYEKSNKYTFIVLTWLIFSDLVKSSLFRHYSSGVALNYLDWNLCFLRCWRHSKESPKSIP